jgi:hypothetical protein
MTIQTTAKEVSKMNLTPLFNQEILRVAKAENRTDEKSMKQFLEELAELCGVGLRMVYHWRSGRNKLPSDHVPALCKRFGSLALLDAMNRAAADTSISIPDNYELAILVSQTVREDLEVYEQILRDFESDGIQPGELPRMRELEARVHANVHRLVEIAEADCARRQNAPRKGNQPAAKKPDSKFHIPDSRKQVGR